MVEGNIEVIKGLNDSKHSHPPNREETAAEKITARIKRKVEEHLEQHPAQLLRTELQGVPAAYSANFRSKLHSLGLSEERGERTYLRIPELIVWMKETKVVSKDHPDLLKFQKEQGYTEVCISELSLGKLVKARPFTEHCNTPLLHTIFA